jgi:hypothetical protein
LIRHEFDHADDEEKPEKGPYPSLVSQEIKWNPAEKQVLHIGGGHEKNKCGTEPLFEVLF